ncbi:hypothetical protein, conserved [Eimeria maxima]|uniref:Uncharacterized protein n=1 Tax=Eimeria maxima TaxID=5804 RepID=U6M656_EIMMA|nr:hypothetical protein, conserved [Eimeria maxima]CDJ57145.1 hypothetical protein, conserved [Eimeria maxima]
MLFAHGSHAFARNLLGSGQGSLQHHNEGALPAVQLAETHVPSFLLGTEKEQQQQQEQVQEEQLQDQEQDQQQEEQQIEGSNGDGEQLSVEHIIDGGEAAALAQLEEKINSGQVPEEKFKDLARDAYTAFIQEAEKSLDDLELTIKSLEEGMNNNNNNNNNINNKELNSNPHHNHIHHHHHHSPSFLQQQDKENTQQDIKPHGGNSGSSGPEERGDQQEEEGGGQEDHDQEGDGEEDVDDQGDGLVGARTKSLWDEARDQAKETVEDMKDRTREWGERVQTLIDHAKSDAKRAAKRAKTAITQGVKKAYGKVKQGMKNFFDKLGRKIGGEDEVAPAGEGGAGGGGGDGDTSASSSATGEEDEDEQLRKKLFGGGLHPPKETDEEGRGDAEGIKELKLEDALAPRTGGTGARPPPAAPAGAANPTTAGGGGEKNQGPTAPSSALEVQETTAGAAN